MSWPDAPFLSSTEYHEMSPPDRAIVDSQPNKWQLDYDTGRYVNVQHPDNEEWRLMREAVEARALLR